MTSSLVFFYTFFGKYDLDLRSLNAPVVYDGMLTCHNDSAKFQKDRRSDFFKVRHGSYHRPKFFNFYDFFILVEIAYLIHFTP